MNISLSKEQLTFNCKLKQLQNMNRKKIRRQIFYCIKLFFWRITSATLSWIMCFFINVRIKFVFIDFICSTNFKKSTYFAIIVKIFCDVRITIARLLIFAIIIWSASNRLDWSIVVLLNMNALLSSRCFFRSFVL